MSQYRSPQTPGIDLKFMEGLTPGEIATVQNINGLGDPNVNKLLFWNDTNNQYEFLGLGTGLSITGNTLNGPPVGTGGDLFSANNLSELTNFATARTNLGLGAVATDSVVPVVRGGTGATTASAARTALGVDPAGTDNSTPVTFDIGSNGAYATIVGQVLTFVKINLSDTTHVTGTTAIGSGGTGATTVGGARTNLGLGTAAIQNIPATGNASVTEVVYGTDTRLTDARTPTAHVHAGTDITSGVIAVARLGTGTPGITNYLRGDGAWTVPTKSEVGLGNVDNTSDATKNSATATQTNKRIQRRTRSQTSVATLTPDISSYDKEYLTAQAAALTIANPTGTPVLGETIVISILDNATARALTFGTAYYGIGVALPTTTVVSKRMEIICEYDGTNWSTSYNNQV